MKTIALSLSILLLTVGCETGTRYEKNTTKEMEKNTTKLKKIDASILKLIEDETPEKELGEKSYIEEGKKRVPHKYDPENPLNGDSLEEINREETDEVDKVTGLAKVIESEEFKGGEISNGLQVKSIRVGYHDTYTRLVFDIYKETQKAKEVGKHYVDYDEETGIISVTLNGYRGFSAKIPTFPTKSVIEKIYLNEEVEESEFRFSIRLRDNATVKSYAYKNPARLIIDVRPF